MVAKHWLRKRFFVDYRVQGALIVRVVLYWLTCLLAIMFLLLGWGMVAGPVRPLKVQLTRTLEPFWTGSRGYRCCCCRA